MNDLSRVTLEAANRIDSDFADAVLSGLSQVRKTLPCRYFYDARGSELFEMITRLPEYYPARVETGILRKFAREIAGPSGPDDVLVEFGSGSSLKTEIIIEAMPHLAAYVPIDVSESALDDATRRLAKRFPSLDVRPVAGDFSAPVDFPADLRDCRKVGFFPGSTVGNRTASEAIVLLRSMRRALSPCGRLIVGADLRKDVATLIPAYDDAQGVTAAFNLNLLTRINRELGAAFDIGSFRHRAIYNEAMSRIEMHLVSTRRQTVRMLGHVIRFERGESIHTESSHKYTTQQFRTLARHAGWKPGRVWTDERRLFSVHELFVPQPV